METKIDSLRQERLTFELCDHIKGHSFNPYIDNYSDSSSAKNFFQLNNKSSYLGGFSALQSKDYFHRYFVKNINLEWIALNNPNNLSQTSINRDGCIFTLDFDDTGTILAASNHNHNIEIWDMQEKKVKKVITDHKEIVTGLEFFKNDSSHMMSCSLDK